MKRDDAKKVAELALMLQRQVSLKSLTGIGRHHVIEDAVKLIEKANQMQQLAVLGCNQELTKVQQHREDILCEHILEICAKYKITTYCGDPRGFAMYLKLAREPDGTPSPNNNFGGEDWGIGSC